VRGAAYHLRETGERTGEDAETSKKEDDCSFWAPGLHSDGVGGRFFFPSLIIVIFCTHMSELDDSS
jgi:hypothetical protein